MAQSARCVVRRPDRRPGRRAARALNIQPRDAASGVETKELKSSVVLTLPRHQVLCQHVSSRFVHARRILNLTVFKSALES